MTDASAARSRQKRQGPPMTARHTMAIISQYQPLPGHMPDRLSPRHFHLLALAAEGSTYSSIAAELSIPIGTVRSGLHRAKKTLDRLIAASPP